MSVIKSENDGVFLVNIHLLNHAVIILISFELPITD